MPGTLYLGGGGSADDEAALWSAMLAGHRRILYWPFALDPERLEPADAWLRGQIGDRCPAASVTTWRSLQGRDPDELAGFDLLFVGGGNTFRLLDQVRRHGFVSPVREFVRQGGGYYGGSAGAILASPSIAIAGLLDRNEVGLVDLTALGLLSATVLPHYTVEQQVSSQSWSGQHGQPVLAVPEQSGLVVTGDEVRVLGDRDVWLLTGRDARRQRPGASLRLP